MYFATTAQIADLNVGFSAALNPPDHAAGGQLLACAGKYSATRTQFRFRSSAHRGKQTAMRRLLALAAIGAGALFPQDTKSCAYDALEQTTACHVAFTAANLFQGLQVREGVRDRSEIQIPECRLGIGDRARLRLRSFPPRRRVIWVRPLLLGSRARTPARKFSHRKSYLPHAGTVSWRTLYRAAASFSAPHLAGAEAPGSTLKRAPPSNQSFHAYTQTKWHWAVQPGLHNE
jgi:hypothetical protein